MCGIAGRASTSAPIDGEAIAAMCAAIVHRGPDSTGVVAEDGVGLGIQRLRVIDLETGDQPIYNEDESVAVVLNGEIYNYRELRAELERAGHRFRTRSDTEVIVHLYEDLGDRCVERLRGMFAFALHDRRHRRLLLARDRTGKKPLFYREHDGELWFASEPRAILADPAVPRDVDYDALDCYLQFGYVPDPLSAFAALRKLPPAHTLAWSEGRSELRRYWRLSYARKLDVADPREIAELVRERLLEATSLRMRSDVPLGAFLSGGVDSAAVVAAMARQSGERIRTFSIGFDVDEYDETEHARRVSELYGTEHRELRVEPHALDVLGRLVWHYGEPFADPSAIPSFYLAELAREDVTVALNGDGGDESFAGYERYHVHAVADRLERVPVPLARGARRLLDAVGARSSRLRPVRAAWWLAQALERSPAGRYAHTMQTFSEPFRDELYGDDFKAALAESPHLTADSLIEDAYASSDAPDAVERLLDVDVRTYLPGDLLVKVDIATMAHSLEVRSPFLDHELMELAASLPLPAKLRGSTGKVALKDAVRDWLPDEILDRPKMGFRVPLDHWFRGELRDLPSTILLDGRARERGLFRPAAIERMIAAHHDGREDCSLRLWTLLQVELWLRTYIDRVAAEPLAVGVA